MNFIAHIRESDGQKQLLRQHLLETSVLAEKNGSAIAMKQTAFLAGLLHDCGKYSDAFQTYLRQAAKEPNSVTRGSVDHSTYGGQLLWELAESAFEKLAVEIIANGIFAHHRGGGLLDYISLNQGEFDVPFKNRLNKKLPDYLQVKERFYQEVITEDELRASLKESSQEIASFFQQARNLKRHGSSLFFLNKFIYSCLLDADRTNTYLFESGQVAVNFDTVQYFTQAQRHLEDKFAFFANFPPTRIQTLRQQMSLACLEAAQRPTDIYRLSIPTGGGKTFGSLRFSLAHALKHNKKRIIYVVPFTTILEQNVNEVRTALHDTEHILEHHANIFFEDEADGKNVEELERKQALLEDNWEAPIIFTTMVRFLEVVFGGSTRNPRRFHQLMEAVIVFDEIQAIPANCIEMFNFLLEFLKNFGQTTSLLCTATQPALDSVAVKLTIPPENELIANLPEIYQAFKRTAVQPLMKPEGWQVVDIVNLVEEIRQVDQQILIILNTKAAVQKVYNALHEELPESNCYHLSTGMCGQHRQDVLTEIKKRLENHQPVICVTTPLIEAGVDISFAAVIRSTTGLDSIAQAAGRCNRNGESEILKNVYVINPQKSLENVSRLSQIKIGKELTEERIHKAVFTQTELDLLDPQEVRNYFKNYYQAIAPTLGYPIKEPPTNLVLLMNDNPNWRSGCGTALFSGVLTQSPGTIAKNFQVIENLTKSVIVPYENEGEEIIAQLGRDLKPEETREWLKKAQRYAINLFERDFQALGKAGLLVPLAGEVGYALRESTYDKLFGLNLEGVSLMGLNFF